MRTTQQSLFNELSGNRNFYYTFVQEGSPETVGLPKLTLPDLPAYVGFYTLFDSAVRFVFCSSEIGSAKAVQAPGCILALPVGIQLPDALF